MSEKIQINQDNTDVSINLGCEAISIVSGKGGTGKSIVAVCLAYVLQKAGKRVCLIDTDFATQGLSLFILGQGAERGASDLRENHSLYHMVENWQPSHALPIMKRVDRHDHGESYNLVVSNKQFYDKRLSLGTSSHSIEANRILTESMGELSDKFRQNYRELIASLIMKIKQEDKYDYIIIDTRGGFGETSLVPAVYSDTFIVVAEPDYTSFHQLAKLLTNIDLMAKEVKSNPFIRGIIVNKAVDAEEEKFRSLLEVQFNVGFGLSWPIPLDRDVILAYKEQQVPYIEFPGTAFCNKSLEAFTGIFDIVTAEWSIENKKKWHEFANQIGNEYETQRITDELSTLDNTEKKKLIEELTMRANSAEQREEQLKSELDSKLNQITSVVRSMDKLEHILESQNDKFQTSLRNLRSVFFYILFGIAITVFFTWTQINYQIKSTQNSIDEVESSIDRKLLNIESKVIEEMRDKYEKFERSTYEYRAQLRYLENDKGEYKYIVSEIKSDIERLRIKIEELESQKINRQEQK